jgi:hypothetical protein
VASATNGAVAIVVSEAVTSRKRPAKSCCHAAWREAPVAALHRGAPADLADDRVARLAPEGEGGHAAGPGLGEAVEVDLLQHHARHRPGDDRAEAEIAPAEHGDGEGLPVGVGAVAVGKEPERHRSLDAFLQQAGARDGIAPPASVPLAT